MEQSNRLNDVGGGKSTRKMNKRTGVMHGAGVGEAELVGDTAFVSETAGGGV